MIRFESIKFKNFLSVGNNFIEIRLDKSPTTVLLGSSGTGKSILTDAVSFVLFNKPYRNIGKPQLVNATNNKDCVVEISFSIGDISYFIRRGIKPAIFEIYKNGKLLNQDSHNKDYQDYLEKQILQFNYTSFKQIVVLGPSGFVPFMQLKSSDRRELVEELLGLQIFSVMNTILKDRISAIKTEILDSEYQEKFLNEKSALYEEHKKKLEQNVEQKKEELSNKRLEYCKKVSDSMSEIESLNSSISTLQTKTNKQDTIASISKYSELKNRFSLSITNLRKQIEFYMKNNSCPTCKQVIDSAFKASEIESKTVKKSEISNALDTVEIKISSLEKQKSDIEDIERQIRLLNNKIQQLQSVIRINEELIKSIDTDLLSLTQKTEDVLVEDVQNQILALQENKKCILNRKSLHEIAGTFLKDTGIKSSIVKNYLPAINKYLNKYLQEMNFYVRFSLDENFTESVKSLGYENFVYGNFSEGERQRIDLAMIFTWRSIAIARNRVRTNLLIMDEIFDSALDLNATENVINLLYSDIFKDMNVFVISHKNQIKDKFKSSIEFDKRNSFTKLL